MSASLVRKGLQIVDPEYNTIKQRRKKGKEVFRLTPDNHKWITKSYKNGKGVKVNLLSNERKLTVSEARKNYKSKEQIFQENLKKLELMKSASKVELDKDTLNQIIERAVRKRPIQKAKNKSKKNQKTAFTEEDFKKFEEEYFNE